MSEDSKDCWECRLISGGGLLAMGIYVVYSSKNLKSFSKPAVTSIGYGLGVLGLLRIFALPPFRILSQFEEKENISVKE